MSISPLKMGTKTALTLVLACSIMIAPGCKKKTTGAGNAEVVKIGKVSFSDLNDVLDVAPRAQDTATSEKILSGLGIAEKSDSLSWGDKTTEGNSYIYSDVKGELDGTPFTASKITVTGLHYDAEEVPHADKLVINDLAMSDEEASLKMAYLGATNIDLEDPSDIFSQFEAMGRPTQMFSNSADKAETTALMIKGATIKSDDAKGTVKHLAYKINGDTQRINFIVRDLDATFTEQDVGAARFTLKNMAADNLYIGNSLTGSFGQLVHNNNYAVEELNMTSDFLDFSIPQAVQSVTVKGNKSIMKSNMPEMVLDLSKIGSFPDPDAKEMASMIAELGYEKMVFSGSSLATADTQTGAVNIENASMNLKDGFKLNYAGNLSGVQALFKDNIAEEDLEALMQSATLNNFEISFTDDSIIDRGFKLGAAVTGQNEKTMRIQAKAGLGMAAMMGGSQPGGEILVEIAGAAGKLLSKGGTMTIKIDPEAPLTAEAFMKAAERQNFSALGITASHN